MSPATFPGGIRSYTTKTDGVDDVEASHINNIQLEVTAIETQLLGKYEFVPLTTYLTSASFNGGAFSDTAKTLIDLSVVFGVPALIKAVLVRVVLRDSGSAAADTYLILSDDAVVGSGIGINALPVDDRWNRNQAIVPCDANGDIYYQVEASGAGTFDIVLEICGYWI